MTMLTDSEQRQLNDEQLDGPTTQKINKRLSEAEERILKQVRPVVEKLEEHDDFINGFAKTFSHVSSFLKKATGAK